MPTFILDEMCGTTYSPLDVPEGFWTQLRGLRNTRGPCLLVSEGEGEESSGLGVGGGQEGKGERWADVDRIVES